MCGLFVHFNFIYWLTNTVNTSISAKCSPHFKLSLMIQTRSANEDPSDLSKMLSAMSK